MATLFALSPGQPVLAQGFGGIPSGPGQPLLPPSLPSTLPMTLPGGQPLPALPGGAQADILQRIIDSAGGRGGSAPFPSYQPPYPSPPQPVPAAAASAPAPRPEAAEPLSNTESFFAARLPEGFPLRQFGYDTF